MGWTNEVPELREISPSARRTLEGFHPMVVPPGGVLFQPGQAVKGYVFVLSGRVGVHLVGPTGREILLYTVEPGSGCIQSTLGLLGGDDYSAEAVAETDVRLVLIPRETFLGLLDSDAGFRTLVFAAFARRMQAMMMLLEKVAFQRVEARLAEALMTREKDGVVHSTQAELATAIGSAREVVSRRLEALARRGVLSVARGEIRILDPDALHDVAQTI